VLKKREVSPAAIEDLGISDYNNSIYAPIQTLLRRFRDRGLIYSSGGFSGTLFFGDAVVSMVSGGETGETANQLDKIVVQVEETDQIQATSELLKRMMKRRHSDVDDVEINIPELLLKQQQRTKDIFNIVLFAIASISLIVGGIGIMNIMLA